MREISKEHTPEKKWTRILTLLLFLPLLIVPIELDNDVWFILNCGRYVMSNGFPTIEPFSMQENMSFVMQQWLTDVIYWNIYNVLGTVGLFVFLFIIMMITIVVINKMCLLVSGGNFTVSFAVTLFSSCLMAIFFTTRPQIISGLIFSIEIYLIEKYIRKHDAKYIMFLPLLSLLLINTHASMWFMFFIFALPFVVDSFKYKIIIFKSEGFRKTPFYLSLAVSALVGFLNPYGIKAITYIFRSFGYDCINSTVAEMQPPSFATNTGKVFFVALGMCAAALVLNRKGSTKVRYLLLGTGTLILSAMSYRSILLFSIAIPAALAYNLKNLRPKESAEDGSNNSNNKMRIVLVSLICIMIVCTVGIKMYKSQTNPQVVQSKGAVDYILDNNKAEDVVLYTGYDDGDYAEFRGIKCYIDARAEVFLKSNNGQFDYFIEYYNMQTKVTHYSEVLNKYNFTHIYANTGDILYAYLPKDSNYKKVYEDVYGCVYVPVNK